MHFAMGMGCAGALAGAACVVTRRGWRFIPAAMTAGGVWALVPDLPRVFREDFPSLPLALILGDKGIERALHSVGDVFFFHRMLDAQPKEYALAGLTIILLLYNLAIGLLMVLESNQRNSVGNRSWRAHTPHLRHRRRGRRSESAHTPQPEPEVGGDPPDPVIHRIEPDGHHRITPRLHPRPRGHHRRTGTDPDRVDSAPRSDPSSAL
jgi:hypothetical protein